MCKVNYKDNKSLRLHLVKAKCAPRGSSSNSDEEQFACHRCEDVFLERATLLRHLLFQCSRKQDLECSKCEKVFATDDDLAQHVEACVVHNARFPPELSVGGKETRIDCDQCGRTFISKNSLRQHSKYCKVQQVAASPEMDKEEISESDLKPCTIRVGRSPTVLGRRKPIGRMRRSPKKFADESFEKGWADTRNSKPECILQQSTPTSSKKKSAMQLIRLSSGKVMQVIGHVKNPKGSSDPMAGYVLKDFAGKVTEVKTLPVSPKDQSSRIEDKTGSSKEQQEPFTESESLNISETDKLKDTFEEDKEFTIAEKETHRDSHENVITVSIDEHELDYQIS